MLRTPSKATLAIGGINQQDFKEIQLVRGAFPHQVGLQKRIPGKVVQSIHDGPIGAIYVFYLIYGRSYRLLDFGNIQIEEVVVPPITLPGLPPTSDLWFDTFSGYAEGLLSRIWGAGVWSGGPGICETIIEGIIDPFLVYATFIPNPPKTSDLPIAEPTPTEDPSTPPAEQGIDELPDGSYTEHNISAFGIIEQFQQDTGYITNERISVPYPEQIPEQEPLDFLGESYPEEATDNEFEAYLAQESGVSYGTVIGVESTATDTRRTVCSRAQAFIDLRSFNPFSRVFLVGTASFKDENNVTQTEQYVKEITSALHDSNYYITLDPKVKPEYHYGAWTLGGAKGKTSSYTLSIPTFRVYT